MRRPIFFYSARTQFENVGDALINRELIKLLRANGQFRAVVGGVPEAFLRDVGIEPEEIVARSYGSAALAILQCAIRGEQVYIVQTPGGLGEKFSVQSLLKHVPLCTFSLLGAKVVQVGVSIGNFSPAALELFCKFSRFMHALGIRDDVSLATARDKGFRNFRYFPDLAFAVPQRPARAPGDVSQVAISIRGVKLTPGERSARIQAVSDQLAVIAEHRPINLRIVVQVQFDRAFASELQQALSGYDPEVVEVDRIDALLDLYSGIDLVMTDRLHAFLASGLAGALPVALLAADERKISGLIETLGLDALRVEHGADAGAIRGILDRNRELLALFAEVSERERGRIAATFEDILAA